jgi:hypothetical protein
VVTNSISAEVSEAEVLDEQGVGVQLHPRCRAIALIATLEPPSFPRCDEGVVPLDDVDPFANLHGQSRGIARDYTDAFAGIEKLCKNLAADVARGGSNDDDRKCFSHPIRAMVHSYLATEASQNLYFLSVALRPVASAALAIPDLAAFIFSAYCSGMRVDFQPPA